MTAFLSISPAPVATRPTNFAAAPSKCFHSNVSTVRIPSAGGLRLSHKTHLTQAVDRHSPLRCTKLTITCSTAKPETLTAVTITIAKQLSIDESSVTPETKFSDLGADSLDTVEIMMALEEKFGVSIGEGGAENISTVQDAADLIEKVMVESA